MAPSILSTRALSALLDADAVRDLPRPVYHALAERIRLLVLDGRVPAGTRLPAERDLAAGLGLSRTTVSAAYGALRDAGFLESRQGSGSVVRLPAAAPSSDAGAGTLPLDFAKAAVPAWPGVAAAAERAAARLPAHLGGPGYDLVGLPELRAAVAARYTARGLPTGPDEILVTVGAQHAIAMLAATFVQRGDRVLVEVPSYPHAQDALRAAGGRLVPVAVDAETGWDVDGLEQALARSGPALAYLVPDFQNPTGCTMPEEVRARLLAGAHRQGTVVVADETTAELALEPGVAGPPLGVLAPPGVTVLHVGSVGKTIWGGLRVGWVRGPRALLARLATARPARDLGTPILEQLVVVELFPELDAILAERARHLTTVRDHVEAEVARRFPHWRVPHVRGGLATWIHLGRPVSSQLALAARRHGLVVAAGPRFGVDGAFERHLRLPITYPVGVTDAALDALEAAWEDLRERGPVPEPDLAGVL